MMTHSAPVPPRFPEDQTRPTRVLFSGFAVSIGQYIVFRGGTLGANNMIVAIPDAQWGFGFIDCLDPLTVQRVAVPNGEPVLEHERHDRRHLAHGGALHASGHVHEVQR